MANMTQISTLELQHHHHSERLTRNILSLPFLTSLHCATPFLVLNLHTPPPAWRFKNLSMWMVESELTTLRDIEAHKGLTNAILASKDTLQSLHWHLTALPEEVLTALSGDLKALPLLQLLGVIGTFNSTLNALAKMIDFTKLRGLQLVRETDQEDEIPGVPAVLLRMPATRKLSIQVSPSDATKILAGCTGGWRNCMSCIAGNGWMGMRVRTLEGAPERQLPELAGN